MREFGKICAQYYNLKYKVSGRLFESPYKSQPVDSSIGVIMCSSYIHKNPKDIGTIKCLEDLKCYEFSNLNEFLNPNERIQGTKYEYILEEFNSPDEYWRCFKLDELEEYIRIRLNCNRDTVNRIIRKFENNTAETPINVL
jgi:hypothetical protein